MRVMGTSEMKNRLAGLAGTLTLVALGAFVGCSSTLDDVTNKIDCHTVCKRYADCFNSDYDVDGCSDKCENSADSSETRQSKLHSCDDCIDERSCNSATFNCADACVGIVP
jgi:hypothetical protein